MESSSTNPKPQKSVFSVPSIDEIAEYERQRPKLLSSFKSSKRVARAPPSTSAAPKPAAAVSAAPKAAASSSGQGAASRNDGRHTSGGSSKSSSKSPSKALSKSPAKSQTRSPASSPAKYSGKVTTKRSGHGPRETAVSSPSSSPQSKKTAKSPRSSPQENRLTQSRGSSLSQSKQSQKSSSQRSSAGAGRTSSYGNRASSFQTSAGSSRNSGRQPGGGFDSGTSYRQTSSGSTSTTGGSPSAGSNTTGTSADSRVQKDATSGTSSDLRPMPSTSTAEPGGPSASTSSAGDEGTASASLASRSAASRVQFTTATDFVRSRGKVGSAFADKFRMLGTAEEYKVPLSALAANQPKGDGNAVGTSAPNKAALGNSVIVNARQRGNPILKYIRNIPWEFGDIVPDYVMGRTTCALYLSLRYHHLNPNYIHDRLMELGHKFELRVLLVQVDVKDPHHSVKELARLAIMADCTLMLAWSSEEAGRYLETYKAYENKPADALKEKIEQDHLSKMTDCLTTVKSVNRTDVITLLANYGTFEKVVGASKEELALLPGFGPQKAQRLSNMFTEPFLRRNKRRKVQKETESSEQDSQAT